VYPNPTNVPPPRRLPRSTGGDPARPAHDQTRSSVCPTVLADIALTLAATDGVAGHGLYQWPCNGSRPSASARRCGRLRYPVRLLCGRVPPSPPRAGS